MSYEIMSAEIYSAALKYHLFMFAVSFLGVFGIFLYNSWVGVVCLFVERPTKFCVEFWGVALMACLGSFALATSAVAATALIVL